MYLESKIKNCLSGQEILSHLKCSENITESELEPLTFNNFF
jgi:hypothetical protein